MSELRKDLELISEWVEPGSHVLDLGCGDGRLLAHLSAEREVSGYGIEIDADNVIACIKAGVNVIQSNLDQGLSDFDDSSFDYVIMTQTLQAIRRPDRLLNEMLRVGQQVIVTFPNFGHWYTRIQISLFGRMPVSRALPAEWYDSTNIHLCTIGDFEVLCARLGIEIMECMVADYRHRPTRTMRMFPNLMGEIAMYRLQRRL